MFKWLIKFFWPMESIAYELEEMIRKTDKPAQNLQRVVNLIKDGTLYNPKAIAPAIEEAVRADISYYRRECARKGIETK